MKRREKMKEVDSYNVRSPYIPLLTITRQILNGRHFFYIKNLSYGEYANRVRIFLHWKIKQKLNLPVCRWKQWKGLLLVWGDEMNFNITYRFLGVRTQYSCTSCMCDIVSKSAAILCRIENGCVCTLNRSNCNWFYYCVYLLNVQYSNWILVFKPTNR